MLSSLISSHSTEQKERKLFDGRLRAHSAAIQVGTPRGRTDACQKHSGEEKTTISTPCEQNLGQEGPALLGLRLLEMEKASKTQISIKLAAEEVVLSPSVRLLT